MVRNMSNQDHPNYGDYLKESHVLSQEISARMMRVAQNEGESEQGLLQAKELHLEEARRRKELQIKYGLIPG